MSRGAESRPMQSPQDAARPGHSLWANIFSHPPGEKELVDLLRAVPLFADLGTSALQRLLAMAYVRSYAMGEFVFREGDPGVAVYIVKSGAVDIMSGGESESPVLLAHVDAGDFFGELALLDEETRTATAVARSAAELVAITRPDLQDLASRDPASGAKIVLRLAHVLCARLRHMDQALRRAGLSVGEEIG